MIKTMLCLLIDGYNLLHAAEKGFISSLQEKREKLIDQLHLYQTQKKIPITVVFDSSVPGAGFSKRDKFGELLIIYTDSDQTADEWIGEACRAKPGSYAVVSSDNQVIREAEGFGCVTLSSREFLSKLANLSRTIENPYLEDKGVEDEDDSESLYPRVSTKKKGVAKRLPKKERRKYHQLKNL